MTARDIPIVYLAHQFGGEDENLELAESWCAFLSRHFNALFVAPWVPLARHWANDGESLRRAIELNHAAVRAADGLIAVGGKMSRGVRGELNVALDSSPTAGVVDFTIFGYQEELEQDEHAMNYLAGIYGRAER